MYCCWILDSLAISVISVQTEITDKNGLCQLGF
jgi:hypothetical protein